MLDSLSFLWQKCDGGVRLLKVYGDTPCPVLPEDIDGEPLTEIGAYCFADKPPVAGGTMTPCACTDASRLHPICGNFVESVRLPDTVHLLDSAAFYNCRQLQRVEIGPGIDALGSDLFTNCRSLACISVRCAPDAPTGLRKLLGSISADVEVEFLDAQGTVTAKLFYPEYFEYLDENTPAHIFNHSIEGEGYRYRQCFRDGIVQFTEYDADFPQACIGESAENLCHIALGRLRWPFALSAEARARYSGFLTGHLLDACRPLIAARDLEGLRFLRGLDGLLPEDMTKVAEACGAAGFGPGAALFVAGRHTSRRKTYSFDDL